MLISVAIVASLRFQANVQDFVQGAEWAKLKRVWSDIEQRLEVQFKEKSLRPLKMNYFIAQGSIERIFQNSAVGPFVPEYQAAVELNLSDIDDIVKRLEGGEFDVTSLNDDLYWIGRDLKSMASVVLTSKVDPMRPIFVKAAVKRAGRSVDGIPIKFQSKRSNRKGIDDWRDLGDSVTAARKFCPTNYVFRAVAAGCQDKDVDLGSGPDHQTVEWSLQ
jgi:hypothetical protein